MQELIQQQMETAEQSVNDPAAERRYHEVCAEMTRTDGEIVRLEVALASLETKAQAARTEAQLREQAELRARVVKLLDKRVDFAKSISGHISALVADWREHAFLRPGSEQRNDDVALGWVDDTIDKLREFV